MSLLLNNPSLTPTPSSNNGLIAKIKRFFGITEPEIPVLYGTQQHGNLPAHNGSFEFYDKTVAEVFRHHLIQHLNYKEVPFGVSVINNDPTQIEGQFNYHPLYRHFIILCKNQHDYQNICAFEAKLKSQNAMIGDALNDLV